MPVNRRGVTVFAGTWRARAGLLHRLRRALKDSAGNGDTDTDQDQAAEQLASLPRLGPEPVAEFQADQGQGNADHGDDDRGHGQVDVEGAQREADREVVDAQRRPGDQQPPGPLARWYGHSWVLLT